MTTTLRTVATITLPILTLLAIPPLLLGPQQNGLMELFQGDAETPPSFFAIMIKFILPILEPGNFALSLQALHFFSAWMSTWILMTVESLRPGPPPDGAKRWVWAWGLGIEALGAGIVLPLWCLVNVRNSYGTTFASGAATTATLPAVTDLRALRWSLVFGAGIPAAIMIASPAPAGVAWLAKETWIVARLFHPITAGVVFWVLRRTVFAGRQQSTTAEAGKAVQSLYSFAFWLSAVPHAVILLAVGVAYVAPATFDARVVAGLAPEAIWPSSYPWTAYPGKIENEIAGIASFLIWDEVVAMLAASLWALTVNFTSPGKTRQTSVFVTIFKALVFLVLVGPGALAVHLIAAKDKRLAKDAASGQTMKDKSR